MPRHALRVARALLLFIVGLVIAAYALAPWAIRRGVERAVETIGLNLEAVEVHRLGLDGLELRNLSLGPSPGIQVEVVVARYTLTGLLRRRVTSIEVRGLDVGLPLFDDSGDEPSPEAKPSAAGEQIEASLRALRAALARLRELPTDTLSLDASRLGISTALGPLSLSGRAQLGSPAGEELRIEADLRLRHAVAEFAGHARLSLEHEKLDANLLLRSLDDTESLSVHLDLDAALDSPEALLEIGLRDLDLPNLASDLTGELALRVRSDGTSHLSVLLDSPLRLDWKEVAAERLPFASDSPLRRALLQPGGLRLSQPAGEAALASVRLAGDGLLDVRTAVAMDLVGEGPAGAFLDARAHLTLAPNGRAVHKIESSQLDLRLDDWPLDLGTADLKLDLAMRGRPDALEGSLGVSARLAPVESEAVVARVASLEGIAAVALRDGALWLELERCSSVSLLDVRLFDATRLDEIRLPVCEATPREPLLRLRLAAPSDTELNVAVAPAALTGSIEREGDSPLGFEATSPRLLLRAESSSQGQLEGVLSTAGGALEVPELKARLAGLTTNLSFTSSGDALRASGRSELASIRQAQIEPSLAAIVELELADDRAQMRARLRDEDARLVVDTVLSHQLASGEGEARFELTDLLFEEDTLQPGDLFRALATVRGIGAISAGGEASWSRDAPLRSRLDAGFDFPVLVAGDFPVRGLAGALHFDSLLPLSTPAGQRITFESAYAGVAMTDGLLDFRIDTRDDAPWITVDELHVLAAGGVAEGEGASPLDGELASGGAFSLRLRGIQLASVIEQFAIAGLSGEGVLDGEIPVRFDADGLWLEGGALRARGPNGWIHYAPPVPPEALGAGTGQDGVGTLLAALENFRYESMRVTIDGGLRGEVVVGVHLAGANPDLYDGVPFELNIPITLPLGSLLRSMAAIYLSEQSLDELREQ